MTAPIKLSELEEKVKLAVAGRRPWVADVSVNDLHRLCAALRELFKAADKAEDLLHVPEHRQDDEWYADQNFVNEALARIRQEIDFT